MDRLFTLLRNGYQFPREGALRLTPTPRQTFENVRVKVLKPHYQLRRLVTAGETITLSEPDAETAIALRRAERL